MYSGYGYYDYFDIFDELRRIERLSLAIDARNIMDEFIKRIISKRHTVSSMQKIKASFVKQIKSLNKLLPVGHRWRGDVI